MFALVHCTFALLGLGSLLLGSDWSVLVTGEKGKRVFSDNRTFALYLQCLMGFLFICWIMSVAGSKIEVNGYCGLTHLIVTFLWRCNLNYSTSVNDVVT